MSSEDLEYKDLEYFAEAVLEQDERFRTFEVRFAMNTNEGGSYHEDEVNNMLYALPSHYVARTEKDFTGNHYWRKTGQAENTTAVISVLDLEDGQDDGTLVDRLIANGK